jgi:ElaA protein
MNTTWQFGSFDELSNRDLYAMLKARQDVFVLEQACLYPDFDGLDQGAHHLIGWRDGKVAAYLRILAPGAKYTEMSIGRVLTSDFARGSGIGRELVGLGVEHAVKLYPGHRIRIGAQAHLEHFYASFGFERISDVYDEDGIPHIDMLR